jgi:hypothetical protein
MFSLEFSQEPRTNAGFPAVLLHQQAAAPFSAATFWCVPCTRWALFCAKRPHFPGFFPRFFKEISQRRDFSGFFILGAVIATSCV